MKQILSIAIPLLFAVRVSAQLPYFASTVGDGKLYGYTSLKFRPGVNKQETYTTFQYGLGSHFAVGTDLYTGPNTYDLSADPSPSSGGVAYWGFLVRYGLNVCKWFNVGAQVTPAFNLTDSFKFACLTNAIYLNGALTSNGNLFWCSNTWWIVNKGSANTFSNNEYLGYNIHLGNGHSITPMAGMIHSWKFDQDPDITAGFYYTYLRHKDGTRDVSKSWSIYVWGNDFLKSHPRFIIGVEFVL